MVVRSCQQIAHELNGKYSDRDGSAPRHAGFENVLWVVDLLNRYERHRVSAERRGIRPVAVQQSHDIDAQAYPCRERA